jgi:Putative Ig domain/Bacterial Ig-like domain (group 2)
MSIQELPPQFFQDVPTCNQVSDWCVLKKRALPIVAVVTLICLAASLGCGAAAGLGAKSNASASAAGLTVNPGSVDFGQQPLGVTSELRLIHITNHSREPITLTDISTIGPFVVKKPTLPVLLAASKSLDVAVRFTPIEKRINNGSLAIAFLATTFAGTHQATSNRYLLVDQALNSRPVGPYISSFVEVGLHGSGTAPAQQVSVEVTPTSATVPRGGSQQFTAAVSGTPNSAVRWFVEGINGGNSGVGTVSARGLYTAPASVSGTRTFTLTAKSIADPTASANASVTSTPLQPSQLAIRTASLPSGTVGIPLQAILQASGGTPGYTWTISSGSLPLGLILGATSGQVSGTPSSSGSYSFIARVRDSSSPAQSATRSFTINVAATPPPLAITTTSLPSITPGMAYNATLSASGGIPPYTWSITAGALPAGLTLSPAGVIAGTPTTQGTFSFTILVADSAR